MTEQKLKQIIKRGSVYSWINHLNNNLIDNSSSRECKTCFYCGEAIYDEYVRIILRLKKKGWLDEDYKYQCCWCKLLRENLPEEIFQQCLSHNDVIIYNDEDSNVKIFDLE